jgi:hypothetical protein
MTHISILPITITSTASLSANRLVGYDGNYAAAAGVALGVSLIPSDISSVADEDLTVETLGQVSIHGDEAFTPGDDIAVGSDGKAVKATAGDHVVARALSTTSGADEMVKALLLQRCSAFLL